MGLEEFPFVDTLPTSLRTEISLFLNRHTIENVPLFIGASEKFIEEIAMVLKPVVFMPDNYIFKAGEIGSQMYFISRGQAEVLSADEKKVLKTLGEGDFCGEIALLFDQPRNASVKAVTYCNLYQLEKEQLDKILERYPMLRERIQQMAKIRMRESNTPWENSHPDPIG